MSNSLASIKVQVAVRLEQTQAFRREGHGSAAHQLAHATGTSVGRARSELEAGKPLHAYPLTSEQRKAIRSFQLFSEKPRLIVVNTADDESQPERFRSLAPEGAELLARSATDYTAPGSETSASQHRSIGPSPTGRRPGALR